MRDILKLHSGTQSGTPVSPKKMGKINGFSARGKIMKISSLYVKFTRKKPIVS